MPMYSYLLEDLKTYVDVTDLKAKIRGSNSAFDAAEVVEKELTEKVRRLHRYKQKLIDREKTVLFVGMLLGGALTFLIISIISIT